jgi:hypothetical protein
MTSPISALATAAGRAFGPATAVLGRLRYAQKFALIGLVLLAPLAYVVNAYVTEKGAQIAFSAKERVGTEYMTPATAGRRGGLREAERRAGRARRLAGGAAGRRCPPRRRARHHEAGRRAGRPDRRPGGGGR